jgi:hypothetical protein
VSGAAGNAVRIVEDRAGVDHLVRGGDLSLLAREDSALGRGARRIGRALRGRLVGLALAGGGSLGFAQIGSHCWLSPTLRERATALEISPVISA